MQAWQWAPHRRLQFAAGHWKSAYKLQGNDDYISAKSTQKFLYVVHLLFRKFREGLRYYLIWTDIILETFPITITAALVRVQNESFESSCANFDDTTIVTISLRACKTCARWCTIYSNSFSIETKRIAAGKKRRLLWNLPSSVVFSEVADGYIGENLWRLTHSENWLTVCHNLSLWQKPFKRIYAAAVALLHCLTNFSISPARNHRMLFSQHRFGL